LVPLARPLTAKLFTILEAAVARHRPVMYLTAKEVALRRNEGSSLEDIQKFLTGFHRQRIAVRLLIGHCVALTRPLHMENMIGIFCTKTPIEQIVIEAVTMAEDLCMITYGVVPIVEISCTDSKNNLLYIPRYLLIN
jgi:hypothetical protein